MNIKPIRNTFFSIILSSMFLVGPLQIVNASRLGSININLPREKTTLVTKRGYGLKKSKAVEFERTQLSVETTIPESSNDSILKAMSEYLNDDTKTNTSTIIDDFKKASFALDNIWVTYLIYSNSNTIKFNGNIDLIHPKTSSEIKKIITNNEKIEMYISEHSFISDSYYNHISGVIQNTLPYINILLSWFEYLNSIKIISNESLSEIKYESFGTYCV